MVARTGARDVTSGGERAARVLARVQAIPRGCVRTYGDIDPAAPRFVGRILASTHEAVPWHRVVRADGSVPMGVPQLARLRREGIPFRGARVDLSRCRPPQALMSERESRGTTMPQTEPKDVDAYIAAAPAAAQPKLRQLRHTITGAAPKAVERMSYHMPSYELDGRLVYFAGYKGHVALYAAGSAIAAFPEELAEYAGPKGTLRFPVDRPLPVALIRKVVALRVKENRARARS